ncbi:MAG: GNAT family N-acetyltransferase [Candidatus Hodarchaeota archaeon]
MEQEAVTLRKADIGKDRDFLLELKCEIGYAGASDEIKAAGYSKYKKSWHGAIVHDDVTRVDAEIIQLENLLQDDNAVVYIASKGGEDIGFVSGYVFMEQRSKWGHLEEICLMEKYRNQGLATEIIGKLLVEVHDLGVEIFRFQVSAHNEPAIKFLKKFGGYPVKTLYEVPLKKVFSYFKKEKELNA